MSISHRTFFTVNTVYADSIWGVWENRCCAMISGASNVKNVKDTNVKLQKTDVSSEKEIGPGKKRSRVVK